MLKKRLISASIGLGILFGGIVLYKGFQAWTQASHKRQRPPAVVSTEEARVVLWAQRLRAVGSISATKSATITSEIAGTVKEILFKSGDRVEKNSVLVKLDDTVDKAALNIKIANSRLAKVQFDRTRELLPQKAVSKSAYDQARAKHFVALAEVRQQQAINAQKVIKAPFTGLIGIRKISVGTYIKAGDAFAKLHALDPVYFDYSLPERDFRILKEGQTVEIKTDAWPEQTFSGKIDAIEPGIDIGTRTVKIRAKFNNPEGKLRPGMFGEAYTIIGEPLPTITVPRTAVEFNVYGDFIYVVKKAKVKAKAKAKAKVTQGSTKNKASLWVTKRISIKSGKMRQGRIEIVSGLKAGDQVVVAGINKLRRSGQKVRVNNAAPLTHKLGTDK